MSIDLYVGGHAGTLPGRNGEREPDTLGGKRMFTAAHPPNYVGFHQNALSGILDSGAFTHVRKNIRLTPDQVLDNQLAWEERASNKWGFDWRASALVSYDRLIDEVHVNGTRKKQRWSIRDAEAAVRETIESAHYLASQREQLRHRRLILSCQGVDAGQYRDCVSAILEFATPADIIGFGGWCILGRFKTWLPEFWRTLYATFPLIVAAGIRDIHIFGVLYQPALGGMLYLADEYGLNISTDSTAPILSALGDSRKAGCRAASGYWLDNVMEWRRILSNLRQSIYYRRPPKREMVRQLELA